MVLQICHKSIEWKEEITTDLHVTSNYLTSTCYQLNWTLIALLLSKPFEILSKKREYASFNLLRPTLGRCYSWNFSDFNTFLW